MIFIPRKYAGNWIALRNDNIIDADKKFSILVERLKQKKLLKKIVLTYIKK